MEKGLAKDACFDERLILHAMFLTIDSDEGFGNVQNDSKFLRFFRNLPPLIPRCPLAARHVGSSETLAFADSPVFGCI
ncbi:MAG: hypothetical protein WBD31_29240 [Rubripirellula sp.]